MRRYGGIYLLALRLPGPPQARLEFPGNGSFLIYIGKAGDFTPETGFSSSTMASRVLDEEKGMWQQTSNDLLRLCSPDFDIQPSDRVPYNRLVFQAATPYMRAIRWQEVLNRVDFTYNFSMGVPRELIADMSREIEFPFRVYPILGILGNEDTDIKQVESFYIKEFLEEEKIRNTRLHTLTRNFIPRGSLVLLANQTQLPPGFNAIDSDFLEETMFADANEISLINHQDIVYYMKRLNYTSYTDMIEKIRAVNALP